MNSPYSMSSCSSKPGGHMFRERDAKRGASICLDPWVFMWKTVLYNQQWTGRLGKKQTVALSHWDFIVKSQWTKLIHLLFLICFLNIYLCFQYYTWLPLIIIDVGLLTSTSLKIQNLSTCWIEQELGLDIF